MILKHVILLVLVSVGAAWLSPWLALLLTPLCLWRYWQTLPAPLVWAGCWFPYLLTAGFAHAGYAWAQWLLMLLGLSAPVGVGLVGLGLIVLAALADAGRRLTLDLSTREATPGFDVAMGGRRCWGYRWETVAGASAWRVRGGVASG